MARSNGFSFNGLLFNSLSDKRVGAIPNSMASLCAQMDSLGMAMAKSDYGESYEEIYSRKVFIGGLPPDIAEGEIIECFGRFGNVSVDWPYKAVNRSPFPPKGYAFLLFQEEISVQKLMNTCSEGEDEKKYISTSSPSVKEKLVQVRPWKLSDSDFTLDCSLPLDPRKTTFIGGVPRTVRSAELALIADKLFGGVCYAGIDTDNEFNYPKGSGRVVFSNRESFMKAVAAGYFEIPQAEAEKKRVEVKPFVLNNQNCDICGSGSSEGGGAFFCGHIRCLRYHCDHCWAAIHSVVGLQYHKPMAKEGADRQGGAMCYLRRFNRI